MSRLELTAEMIADVEKVWDGSALFKLTNQQLHEIIEARGLVAETDANKRSLVQTILDEQEAANNSEGNSEVVAENKTAAASTFETQSRVGGGDAGAPEPDNFKDDDVLLGSDELDSHLDVCGEMVQLGTVVQRAFVESAMTAKAWNEQSAEVRDALIVGALELMRKEKAEELAARKKFDEVKLMPPGVEASNVEVRMNEAKVVAPKESFKGLFDSKQRKGAKLIDALKEGAKEAGTLHGHIDDLPNPLVAKSV